MESQDSEEPFDMNLSDSEDEVSCQAPPRVKRPRSVVKPSIVETSEDHETLADNQNDPLDLDALISEEPRWTPFRDRISAGTVELNAKKKLGFDGLFDQTDPDIDVIGMCSGKFVSQDGGMSQASNM